MNSPRPLCFCGCGMHTNFDKRHTKNWCRFISGHNARVDNPMKGTHRYGVDAPNPFGINKWTKNKKETTDSPQGNVIGQKR